MERADQDIECMEVWSSAELVRRTTAFSGLDAWVYSRPYDGAARGGDVVYASSCATGRITRLMVADVAGHGTAVATVATDLKRLMQRFVNCLDQTELVRRLNRQFTDLSTQAAFATALVATYFEPTRRLILSNAGHPRPLHFVASRREWRLLGSHDRPATPGPRNLPLGVLGIADYDAADVALADGDLVLAYTDALIECADRDGVALGESGILALVRGLASNDPARFIDTLLTTLERQYPAMLAADDVTVLLVRATPRLVRHSLAQRVRAFGRLCVATARAMRPGADGPPLPDFTIANVGGAILPVLSRVWRAPTREQH